MCSTAVLAHTLVSRELQFHLQGVSMELRRILLTLKKKQTASKKPRLRNQLPSRFRKGLPWIVLVSDTLTKPIPNTIPTWACGCCSVTNSPRPLRVSRQEEVLDLISTPSLPAAHVLL